MPHLLRTMVAVVLCGGGCIGALEPDVGEPQRERCVNEDSDPATDVSFGRDIYANIFHRGVEAGPGCRCHLPSDPSPIGLELVGLDLSSYGALRAGGANSGGTIVVPGQPCDSGIVLKISEGAPFGARMPQDGPPYLTDEEIQVIMDWIAEGAVDD